MRTLFIIFSTILLWSCTAVYHQVDLLDKPQFKLDPQSHVLIATTKDGQYGTIDYDGSGQMTSQEVMNTFLKHTKNVSISAICSSLGSCLVEARDAGYDYLVYPEILCWEDRATEWSGIPDRVEVKITLLTVDNGEIIHSAIISGRGKWASLKWDHPQDLLSRPINTYVSSLY